MVLGVVAGNLVSGQLASRLGRYKPLMLVALGLLLAGLSVKAFTLTASSTQAEVTVKMLLLGLGLGPAVPLYTLAVQNSVPYERMGVATSMTTFSRQMGATIGVALVGSLFASTLAAELPRRMEAAARGLPPQVAARLAGGGPGGAFDAAKLEAKLTEQLDGARAVAARALAGDGLAAVLVAQSPLAEESLKAEVAAGGVPARVHAAFEALARRAAEEGAQALAEDASVPEALRRRLEAARTPERLGQAFAEAEREEAQRQLDAALARLDGVLALARATLGYREAFTEAIRAIYRVAIALALLALLATLSLPALPLRRTVGPAE